jgi:peptidoglycan/LPS O-acetylase OafA/YrhL
MGVAEFFKSRIIRLHPSVILGSVLGLLTFLFDPFGGHPELYGVGKIMLIFLCSICLIPYPAMPDRYFNLFGLNAPSWSLFWEYIANIFYAFILCRMGRRWLLLLAAVSAVVLCLVVYHAHSLMGGWDGKSFWDGGARVSYSFLAGMLVYRFNLIISNKLGFAGLSILLFLAFVVPFNIKWNWLSESLVVLFYFPLVVALGAGSTLSSGFKKICHFSGQISYPLYMTHYAFIWAFGNYYLSHKPSDNQLALIIISSLFILTGVAWLAMVLYDSPVRQYLSNKRKAA